MTASGTVRSGLLIALSTVLLGFTATASAGSGANPAAASTTSSLGEALATSTPEQQALSAHLRAKGALFYGAWWCPACHQQKALFGETGAATLPYLECDKTAAGRQRCNAAEIQVYPTWTMKDKPRLVGVQSLEELKTWLNSPGSN